MTNEWDETALGWDEDPFVRAYATAAFDSLLDVLTLADLDLSRGIALDFGCGTGLLTERLVAAGASVSAVDTSEGMLDVLHAKIEQGGWTGVTTATDLAGQTPHFDVVVCSSVCGFVDDYPATAVELVALLKAGGVFVQWDWERSEPDGNGLTRDEVRSALMNAGLLDVTVDTGFTIEVEGQTMSPLIGHGRRV